MLGGARSGKSSFAEQLLAGKRAVDYVACGLVPDGSDPEWTDRVTLPVRSGAARPARPSGPDPLAPLLDLPGVREAADGARSAVDRLLGHRVLRRESAGGLSASSRR